MGDQMITHASKVLGMNTKSGKGEAAGFWSLYDCRRAEVDAICARLDLDLSCMRVVGSGLKHIRDKTHFHLDPIGVKDPRSVWEHADITHNQFDAALTTGNAIIGELHIRIRGEPYDAWEYDGSDAKVIAQHANKHGLLYRERSSSSGWLDDVLG